MKGRYGILFHEVITLRDIPFFTTEHGVASLTLSQIPYTQSAYIRIQSTQDPQTLLEECLGFCRAAGAEQIFATGHAVCESYPEYTKILAMQVMRDSIKDTDAALFPVTEETLSTWLEIYNQKVRSVPGGAWMTIQMGRDMVKEGGGYFVHRDEKLMGIGKIKGSEICWVASVVPGGGWEVVSALCHGIFEDVVTLEVASENGKAISLYEKMGFIPTAEISTWYRIK